MTAEIARLSPSIAKTLLNRSPLHAWAEHRLLGGKQRESSKEMDQGKLIEAILFGLPMDQFVSIDADSFRTKEARTMRDAAIVEGRVPVLAKDLDKAFEAVDPMKKALTDKGINVDEGENQVRFEWQSLNPQAPGLGEGVACSGVLDKLILDEPHRRCIIRDLKTTDNAHPRMIARKMVDMGYDIQAAAYEEAVNTAHPWTAGVTEFQFIYIEREFPFAVTVVELAGSLREMGQRRWRRAVDTWGRCMATNRWPDYSTIPVRVEALPWQLTQEAEQELDIADAERG